MSIAGKAYYFLAPSHCALKGAGLGDSCSALGNDSCIHDVHGEIIYILEGSVVIDDYIAIDVNDAQLLYDSRKAWLSSNCKHEFTLRYSGDVVLGYRTGSGLDFFESFFPEYLNNVDQAEVDTFGFNGLPLSSFLRVNENVAELKASELGFNSLIDACSVKDYVPLSVDGPFGPAASTLMLMIYIKILGMSVPHMKLEGIDKKLVDNSLQKTPTNTETVSRIKRHWCS